MYQNPKLAVERIAQFIGTPITPTLIGDVLKSSSIVLMKFSSANICYNHLRTGGSGGLRKYFTVHESVR